MKNSFIHGSCCGLDEYSGNNTENRGAAKVAAVSSRKAGRPYLTGWIRWKPQRQIFRQLLETAATTQFGKDNSFARVRGTSFDVAYRYYRSRVPIRSYQDFFTDYYYLNQPTSSTDGLSLI